MFVVDFQMVVKITRVSIMLFVKVMDTAGLSVRVRPSVRRSVLFNSESTC